MTYFIKEQGKLVRPQDYLGIEDALRRGATRRDALGMLTAAGAGAAFAGSLIATAEKSVAASPKRGGQIRFAWAQHGPSDTLDPILATNSIDYGRIRLTYNNLCRIAEDLSAGPELAETFEANPTATEWTFNLRKDVEWHDGSPLTADDVIYSMNRHLGEDSKSKAKVLVGDVKEWIKDDNHTVRAILNAPNAELPVVLGTFHFKVVKDGTADFQMPVGTGPYQVSEFKPGVRSIHTRNDNYWNDGRPYIDQFEVFGITDNVARVNALLSGDIQMMGNLNPQAIPQVEATEGLEVFSVPSGSCNTLVARLDMEPGNTPDFVMALKLLQRRDRVLNVIQKGHGDLGNDQPVGPAYGVDWCKEQGVRQYDPDEAKFLLDRSGITSAQIDVADVALGLLDRCLMLQRELAKLGFDLRLNRVPTDGYWSTTWLKAPMHVGSWNMRPTANMMMTIGFKSDAPWNESRWKNERFDQLLAMARAELDQEKRYEMNCEMQRLCSDNSGVLIATHSAYIDAKVTNLKGFPRVPLAPFGGMEWPEWIWLDA